MSTMASGRIVITKEVILAANGNGCPVTVGVLLRLMDFIVGNARFVVIGVLLGPVRMAVLANFPGPLSPVVDRVANEGKLIDAVLTHGVAGKG